MLRLLILAAFGYILVSGVVYYFQRHLQYSRDTKPLDPPEKSGFPWLKTVSLQTDDGLTLSSWFAPPKNNKGKIIIMYHGNAGRISDRGVKAPYYIERGYGILMVEYRGYGGNDGTPTEQGFYKDARAAIAFLKNQGYDSSQFIIYGESIGTGVAVQMAFETHPPVLILEAPFSSAIDVAKLRYGWLPVDALLIDKYDSISKIKDVKSLLLIVHGDEDPTIPIALSQKLFDAAPHPKEFITINGGHHNDLYDHHAGYIISDWLDKKTAEGVI